MSASPVFQSIGGILVKRCTGCLVTRELERFYMNRASRDGLGNRCVICVRSARNDRYRAIKRRSSSPLLPAAPALETM